MKFISEEVTLASQSCVQKYSLKPTAIHCITVITWHNQQMVKVFKSLTMNIVRLQLMVQQDLQKSLYFTEVLPYLAEKLLVKKSCSRTTSLRCSSLSIEPPSFDRKRTIIIIGSPVNNVIFLTNSCKYSEIKKNSSKQVILYFSDCTD